MSLHSFLIAVVPLVGLVICLVLGRFPGERTIERLRAAIHTIENVRSAPEKPRIRLGFGYIGSGGRLIALSLAGRGPPVARSHHV